MRRAAAAALALVGAAACGRTAGSSPSALACPTCVVADARGFTPASLALAAGGAGETRAVTFTRTSDDTCAREVVFPELDLKRPLPLNEPVAVQIPVDKARTLTFQCGMGMYKSSVVVAVR